MIQTKEEMFLAKMGIHPQTIIEGDYTAKYKLTDLLKKYAEQCNIADVVGQSEQLVVCKKCGSSEMYQYTKTKDKCEECGNIQDY